LNEIAGGGGDLNFADFVESFPLLLAFGYPEFCLQQDFAASVQHVGPIREPLEPPAWPRRYSDRPFVLVSLSTSFQRQTATLQRLCDALAPLPVEALVTTGPSVAVEDLRVGGGVQVQGFVPHDRVVGMADLIVTHARHGTVLMGSGAGVPMLCIPMGRDQHFDASRVEALGLGRSLSPDSPPDEIGRTVMDMIGDTALRAASRSFAARVSRFGELERGANLVEQML
jgi:MGT family glycosyltransferase